MKRPAKKICEFCGKKVSSCGAAWTSHMRMHVREGVAVECKHGKRLLFYREGIDFTQNEPFAKLGSEPVAGQPKDTWDITGDLEELRGVNPADYYITSGEAVKKGEKLVKDAYSLAVKARSFCEKLKKARGKRKYLETSRDNGRLLCKRKDPRNKEQKHGKR